MYSPTGDLGKVLRSGHKLSVGQQVTEDILAVLISNSLLRVRFAVSPNVAG